MKIFALFFDRFKKGSFDVKYFTNLDQRTFSELSHVSRGHNIDSVIMKVC